MKNPSDDRTLQKVRHPQEIYRTLLLIGGTAYLFWWVLVECFLPGSFNPMGSRLGAVSYFWLLCGSSFFVPYLFKNLENLSPTAIWVATAHYFYLLHHNLNDINWLIGCYITVIAGCACLQKIRDLLIYSGWVIFFSGILLIQKRLNYTVFFPGILTILVFAYVSLRSRILWLERSQETAQRFQGLFDAVFEGIVVHEFGIILEANESFAKIFGYAEEDVVGRPILDFIAPEWRDFALAQVRAQIETPYQVSGLKKDGSLFPVEVRGKKHWVKGNLLRLVALSDISKRIQYEQSRILYEASQKAIRMRDEFLSIASHELNTPLTNIKIQTQLMLRKILKGDPTVFEPPKIKRFIEQMDTQVNRLVRLVDEMLDVSRISIEKLTFNKEILDLTQLVREVVLSFEGTLSQSGNPVEFVASQAHWVKVDRFRMEQVVSNLLSNAIKYGESKPILIQLDRKTEDVHLSIQDHGIGIPVEIHERIFERFERAVSSNQVSGLGLGLYIAREIIRAHDGRITVESSLREKTCFSVILPLHRFDEINDLPWSSRIKYP